MKTFARTQDVPPGTIQAYNPTTQPPQALPKSEHPLERSGQPSGPRIALVNVEGMFHAIDDTCTHHGCSLADGRLVGTVLTCACHGSRFDVTTGAVVRGPAERPVRSYPVQVEGDEVQVEV